jgi:hypothetical protein
VAFTVRSGGPFSGLKKLAKKAVRGASKVVRKVDKIADKVHDHVKKAVACVKKDGLGKCVDKAVTKVKQAASTLLNKACKATNLPAVCKATVGKGCKAVVAVAKAGALAVTDTAAKAAAALLNAFLNAMDSIVARLSIDITVQGALSAQRIALGVKFAVAWGASRVAFSAHLELSVGGLAKLVGAVVDKIKKFITSKFKL